jgi:uncharacterized integral membrane protein
MRLLAWLVGLPLTILIILFAVSNRQTITIGLWPLTEGIAAPAYVIGLVPLTFGALLGAGFAGIGTVRARLRHRSALRRARGAERQMEELRARTPAIAPPGSKSNA